MKKYKHIKKDITLFQIDHGELYKGVQFYGSTTNRQVSIPEYLIIGNPEWEEVKAPTFEIQSFKGCYGNIWKLLPNGRYGVYGSISSSLEWMLDLCKPEINNRFFIWSVKRLCDNEIFTINDVTNFGTTCGFRISQSNDRMLVEVHSSSSFYLDATNLPQKLKKAFVTEDGVTIYVGQKYFYINNGIVYEKVAQSTDYVSIPNFYWSTREKAQEFRNRQILLTTEDKVKIFKGDNFYFVKIALSGSIDTMWKVSTPKNGFIYEPDKEKYFSTREKAEEYIWYNKPCLSLNDVATVYATANKKAQPMIVNGKSVFKMGRQPEALLNLVKQKLR